MIGESVNPPQYDPEKLPQNLYEAGCAYFFAGLGILALHDKVPHPKYCPHGFKTPISTLETWWKAAQDPSVTGVGIVLTPHRWVLDIDSDIGWKSLHDKGIFPLDVPTAVAITARGAHFWFQSEYEVHSRPQGARFLPGVDLKASGYVVAPPSMHPSGAEYRWADAPLCFSGYAYMADAPSALEDFIRDLDYADTVLGPSPYLQLAQQSLNPLVSHLRRSSPGERNETLNWCALRAGATGHSLKNTMDALLPAATGIGLTVKESRATIKSGWSAGKASAT